MKRKTKMIIFIVAAVIIAVLVFSAIWFGPKACLKRELGISIPKGAEFTAYRIGFWRIGYELPAWRIRLDSEQYADFAGSLKDSLSQHNDYHYFEDIDDTENDPEQKWLKRLYEESNGFSGFYAIGDEFQWSAYAIRGREPWLVKSLTNIHAVAALGEDGYYYVSIVVM